MGVLFGILSCTPVLVQKKSATLPPVAQAVNYDAQTLARNTLPVLMPYNKVIDPAGKSVYFGDPGNEDHALDCALSPDGKILAVETRYGVVFVDTRSQKVVSQIELRKIKSFRRYMNTLSGIIWSPDGKTVFWSADNKRNDSAVLRAEWTPDSGARLLPDKALHFKGQKKPHGRFLTAIPNEVVLSGHFLFVVLNGNNQVVKIDLQSDQPVWTTTVGVAPFGLTLAAGKMYVTNWGGRQPKHGEETAGTPWDPAAVDSVTGAVSNGTVTVLDPNTGKILKEIPVGLHPNDIVKSPDEWFVYVANANSDNVSVISTETETVTETISVRLMKTAQNFVGDSPNGLAVSPDGKRLYVANGMDNALAVVELGKKASRSGTAHSSRLLGFIPTETYPGAVVVSRNASTLYVANIEAIGSRIAFRKANGAVASPSSAGFFNAHHEKASISIIPVPNEKTLQKFTARVKKNNLTFRMELSKLLPRKNRKPVPVPERIGEPSVFKHVIYIIKENRTYDQVLGDMKEGDGEAKLCSFGEKVTPNHHKLAREFSLLDNYYASGKCSSEGHQWTDSGIVTDYIEKKVRAWFRSYDHIQYDAMVYPEYGFIWNDALANGKRVRIFGEACFVQWDHNRWKTWNDIYTDFVSGKKAFQFVNKSTIAPVNKILSQKFPAYDHKIPDILRAAAFIEELKAYEKMPGDQLPQLMVMALPSDHTAGTRPGYPTPRAMVADNDLALGQIVEAVSKSRFWKNTVILVTEDDSQAGWDHVSAYRTVGFVISPYSRLKKTVHTNYNQTSMLRTIEQILGIPPMNQIDASASPMRDCFSRKPDFSPYTAVSNQIALNEMNPPLKALNGEALKYAKLSLLPEFDKIDSGRDDILNRIIWFATMGNRPYPAKYAGRDDDD
ncbi:MAG: beta-propeller fold lactonase family protein [Calditrichaeota bacterium]|nr:beta-propeller fold lactonase family protein [Calditrichota bacterium]